MLQFTTHNKFSNLARFANSSDPFVIALTTTILLIKFVFCLHVGHDGWHHEFHFNSILNLNWSISFLTHSIYSWSRSLIITHLPNKNYFAYWRFLLNLYKEYGVGTVYFYRCFTFKEFNHIEYSQAYSYAKLVRYNFKIGFSLYIWSEFMMFNTLFYIYIFNAASPSIFIGAKWPPVGLPAFKWQGVAMYNTFLLIASSVFVNWYDVGVRIKGARGDVGSGLWGLFMSGIHFIEMQWFEYIRANISYWDSIYGCTFYLATGFHLLHVSIGVVLILIAGIRVLSDYYIRLEVLLSTKTINVVNNNNSLKELFALSYIITRGLPWVSSRYLLFYSLIYNNFLLYENIFINRCYKFYYPSNFIKGYISQSSIRYGKERGLINNKLITFYKTDLYYVDIYFLCKYVNCLNSVLSWFNIVSPSLLSWSTYSEVFHHYKAKLLHLLGYNFYKPSFILLEYSSFYNRSYFWVTSPWESFIFDLEDIVFYLIGLNCIFFFSFSKFKNYFSIMFRSHYDYQTKKSSVSCDNLKLECLYYKHPFISINFFNDFFNIYWSCFIRDNLISENFNYKDYSYSKRQVVKVLHLGALFRASFLSGFCEPLTRRPKKAVFYGFLYSFSIKLLHVRDSLYACFSFKERCLMAWLFVLLPFCPTTGGMLYALFSCYLCFKLLWLLAMDLNNRFNSWLADELFYAIFSGTWCYKKKPKKCEFYDILYSFSTKLLNAHRLAYSCFSFKERYLILFYFILLPFFPTIVGGVLYCLFVCYLNFKLIQSPNIKYNRFIILIVVIFGVGLAIYTYHWGAFCAFIKLCLEASRALIKSPLKEGWRAVLDSFKVEDMNKKPTIETAWGDRDIEVYIKVVKKYWEARESCIEVVELLFNGVNPFIIRHLDLVFATLLGCIWCLFIAIKWPEYRHGAGIAALIFLAYPLERACKYGWNFFFFCGDGVVIHILLTIDAYIYNLTEACSRTIKILPQFCRGAWELYIYDSSKFLDKNPAKLKMSKWKWDRKVKAIENKNKDSCSVGGDDLGGELTVLERLYEATEGIDIFDRVFLLWELIGYFITTAAGLSQQVWCALGMLLLLSFFHTLLSRYWCDIITVAIGFQITYLLSPVILAFLKYYYLTISINTIVLSYVFWIAVILHVTNFWKWTYGIPSSLSLNIGILLIIFELWFYTSYLTTLICINFILFCLGDTVWWFTRNAGKGYFYSSYYSKVFSYYTTLLSSIEKSYNSWYTITKVFSTILSFETEEQIKTYCSTLPWDSKSLIASSVSKWASLFTISKNLKNKFFLFWQWDYLTWSTMKHSEFLRAVSYYWHFVDIMWLIIFFVCYIL